MATIMGITNLEKPQNLKFIILHLNNSIQVLVFYTIRRLIFLFLFVLTSLFSEAQPIDGATGLMKIPSAEMQKDGTFNVGVNYLPDVITPSEYFDYNTENYYFNITFLPFVEFTYRSTIMKLEDIHNQDRSFGLRWRIIKESDFFPSLVLGGNDIYSSRQGLNLTGKVADGNKFFNSFYGVATKHVEFKQSILGITLGIGTGGNQKLNLNGFFGGITFVPASQPELRLMAEYDADVISCGADYLVLKHIYLFGMVYNMKSFAGGLAYRIYLKK